MSNGTFLHRIRERLTPSALLAFALWAVLFLVVKFVYQAARWVVATEDPTTPRRNADWIIDAERSIGLFIEPDVQRWIENVGLEPVTTWIYTGFHQTAFTIFFVALWFLWHSRFPYVFAWFFTTSFVAVIGYWLFPLAPPRHVPELALNDPTHEALQLGGANRWFVQSDFRNEFAAMPSLHVGYPILFAIVLFFAFRGTPLRWLAWLWPAVMLLAVMASANHFWLDAAGGLVVVVVGAVIVSRVWPDWPAPWSTDLADSEETPEEPASGVPEVPAGRQSGS